MSATQAMVPADRTVNALEAAFAKAKPELEKVLPRHLTAERLWRIAISTVSRTPRLQECTPISILRSVMQSAQLGLEPGTPLGLSYLVPFWNNKINSYECQLIPGYRGLIHLALEGGHVADIVSRVVYAGDYFRWEEGLEPILRHRPEMTEGDVVAVYAIAILRGGVKKFEVMRRSQVDAIRKRSQQPDGAWATDYPEMARKTVVKRLAKYLKLTPGLAAAIELDNRAETGERNNTLELYGDDVVEVPSVMRAPAIPSLVSASDGPTRPEPSARNSSTPLPAAPKASAAPPTPPAPASVPRPAQAAAPAEATPTEAAPAAAAAKPAATPQEQRRGDPPPVRAMASPAPGNPPVVSAKVAEDEELDRFFGSPPGASSTPAPSKPPRCGVMNGTVVETSDGLAWLSCALVPEHPDAPHHFQGLTLHTGPSDEEGSGSMALRDNLGERLAAAKTLKELDDVGKMIKACVDRGDLITAAQQKHLQDWFLAKKRELQAAARAAAEAAK